MFLFEDFFSDGFQLLTGDTSRASVSCYVVGQLRKLEDGHRGVVQVKGGMVVCEDHYTFNPYAQLS